MSARGDDGSTSDAAPIPRARPRTWTPPALVDMLGVAMRPAPVLLIAVQSHGHWFGMGDPRGMGAEGMLGSIQPQAEIKSHSTPFAVMICLFGLASMALVKISSFNFPGQDQF